MSSEWAHRLAIILSKPWIGAITAVATVLAGALASFFPEDIKSSIYPFFVGGSVSWTATSFWLAVISVGALLGSSQWSQLRLADEARSKLDAQVLDLQSLVHRIESLPPEDFLAKYQELLRIPANSALAITIEEQGSIETIESAIRGILGSILLLAKGYDKRREAAVYAANVMLYRADGRTEGDPTVLIPNVPIGHPDYEGYLELIPNLTTTTAEDGFGPDPAAIQMCMHIPRCTETVRDADFSPRTAVLPGAPWAFVFKEYAGFDSIRDVDGWLRNRSSVDTQTKERIRYYFRDGDGKNIQSFVSMPLLGLGSASEGLPVGVLNLHSDTEGLLKDKGGERFSPLLEPFRFLLTYLIIVRNERLEPKE